MRYVDSALDDAPDNCLAAWLRQELPAATTLTLRTGFYSSAALELVRNDLEEMLARGGSFLAVLGGDLLQVDTTALGALVKLCESYPDNARVYVTTESVFQNAKTYHLAHPDGRSTAWVGSANFSIGGLVENLEASVTMASDQDDPEMLDRVRAATLAAAEESVAMPLTGELIEQFRQRVRESRFGFGRPSLGPTTRLINGYAADLLDQLHRIASGDHRPLGVTTGFSALDDLLGGGLRPGTLTVVASRPGAGRSTLVLNMLCHAALTNGVPSCLFTFQGSAQDVLLRVLSAETGIKFTDLRRSQMTDLDWTYTADRLSKLAGQPLSVNAGAAPHLEGLISAVTAATAREELALVAIDPLSAVFARTFADNREREIAEVVRRLQELAVRLEISLIVTAELGRQAEYADWRPRLSDLRDSDVIAQVADHVILLDNSGRTERDLAHLLLAKNRYGRRGTIPVIPRLSVARFRPVFAASSAAAGPRGHVPDDTTPAPATSPLSTSPTAAGTTPETTPAEHDPVVPNPVAPEKTRLARTPTGPSKIIVWSHGEGDPTVILLGRADPAADEWTQLCAHLASVTRIVGFERAGSAVGDPFSTQVARGLRNVSGDIWELGDLLRQARIPAPYVVVASSIGCWIADQFAVREPRKVAGAVLIDPTNLTPWPISAHHRPGTSNDGETGYLLKPSTESYVDLACSKPTDPRRTVVISSSDGRWQRHQPASATAWTPGALIEMDQLWQGFQRDWVRRTKARHIVADTAGHLVHRDQPELVAHVVTAVVEATRDKAILRLDPAEIKAAGGRLESASRGARALLTDINYRRKSDT